MSVIDRTRGADLGHGEPTGPSPDRALAWPAREALAEFDHQVEAALASGREHELEILGSGEQFAVLAWNTDHGRFACKRLPAFPDQTRFEAYCAVLEAYMAQLSAAGVAVLDTRVLGLDRPDGHVVAYCLQPAIPPDLFLHEQLARSSPAAARPLIDQLARALVAAVSDHVGIDPHVTNWLVRGTQLVYIDVSTPLLRDDRGHERLETELFLGSLPWLVRGYVKRFVLRDLLDRFYDRRRVFLELLSGLHHERLGHLVPAHLDRIGHLVTPALTEPQIWRHHRIDVRLFAMLQRLRRMDRLWQRQVRRRRYPYLLPRPPRRPREPPSRGHAHV
jgi:hypothetical protein